MWWIYIFILKKKTLREVWLENSDWGKRDADNPNEIDTGMVLGPDADKCKPIRAWRFWHPKGRYIISTWELCPVISTKIESTAEPTVLWKPWGKGSVFQTFSLLKRDPKLHMCFNHLNTVTQNLFFKITGLWFLTLSSVESEKGGGRSPITKSEQQLPQKEYAVFNITGH